MTSSAEHESAERRVFNTGVTQAERQDGLPKPQTVQVDGRAQPALLAFAADYGRLIRFFDLSNQPSGDWSGFFAADPSIASARLLGLDIEGLASDGDRILGELRRARARHTRLAHAQEALQALRRLIRLLDPAPAGAEDDAGTLARVLAADLGQFFAPVLAELSVWLRVGELETWLGAADEATHEVRFAALLALLTEAMTGLISALAAKIQAATATFVAAQGRKDHAPQAAIWIAFVELFAQAQTTLNKFSGRFIDFYYEKILRQTQSNAAPFTASLAIPDAAASTASPPPAAPAVALASLRIIRQVAAKPPAFGGAVLGGQVLSDTPPVIAAPFPLFGADEPGTSGPLTTSDASLGFAITSLTLLLAGGTRTISISLTLSAASLAALTPDLTAIGAAGGLAPGTVLAQILQAAFALSYSTAGGWMNVQGFSVTAPASGESGPFVLAFTLPDSAAPLTGLNAQPASKGAVPPAPGSAVPSPDQPTILARLLQAPIKLGTGSTAASVTPYGLLKNVELEGLILGVTVVGLSDLVLSTGAGPVLAGQVFAPFGSPPVQGAALDIFAPELFAKVPGSLSLSLTWSGLPTQNTGFQGYYQGYSLNADGQPVLPGSLFDNASFTAALTVVAPGLWSLRAAQLPLFNTSLGALPAAAAPLLANATLAAPIPAAQPAPSYYEPSASRLRLSLATPSYAFGNTLYAPAMAAAAVQLSAAASSCAQQCAKSQGKSNPALARARAALSSAQTSNARPVNATTAQATSKAVSVAIAQLNSAALQTLHRGIGASTASPQAKGIVVNALETAASDALTAFAPPGVHLLLGAVEGWINIHAAGLGSGALGSVAQAHTLLREAAKLTAAHASARMLSPAAAHAALTPALNSAQASVTASGNTMQQCLQACMASQASALPNPPWLPKLASLTVSYSASTSLPVSPPGAAFFYLTPFAGIAPVVWPSGGAVPLLLRIAETAGLYVELSPSPPDTSLNFTLQAPKSGWPADPPVAQWQQAVAGGWAPLTPTSDSSEGLRQSGTVTLALAQPAENDSPLLRAIITGNTVNSVLLAALTVSPSLPVPAALAQPAVPAPTAAIPPPAPVSAATSAAFQVWMGEHARHKGAGIQAWDYGRLVLSDFPQIWQVGVAPATDENGCSAAGHVWLAVVPGPSAPSISDPTAPLADPQLLAAVKSRLVPKLSPFVQLHVTNPPYARITVTADLLFSAAQPLTASLAQLNADLIAWLSPWPDAALGNRPPHYYARQQIAEFIRRRPYVRGIVSLHSSAALPPESDGWAYYISAARHVLSGQVTASAGSAVA